MNDREAGWTRVNLIIAISDADWAWSVEDRKLQEAQKELDELAAKWDQVERRYADAQKECSLNNAWGVEYAHSLHYRYIQNQLRAYDGWTQAKNARKNHIDRVEALKKIIGDATAERTKQQYRLAHLRKEQSEQSSDEQSTTTQG